MNAKPLVLFLAVALTTLLSLAACESGDGTSTPPADVTTITDVGEEPGPDVAVPTGACHECLAVGMGFRFSDLVVLEPSEPIQLPNFLNNIWKPDVEDNRLNIMLQITDIVDNNDGTKDITFRAGSAWHDLTMEEVLPVGGAATPSSYHFVGPEPTQFVAVLQADCRFSTIGDSNKLLFHPGPNDHALICSHGDPAIELPKDTIPIANLIATGAIADDCQHIVEGHLTGCIAEEAAGQICSFGMAPNYATWTYEQNEEITPEDFKGSYCQRWCGQIGWANFGGFTRTVGTGLACDIDRDGTNDAYGLAGDWIATQVNVDAD